MEEKLIKYLTTFQLSDLIGFAAILRVQEEEDFYKNGEENLQ